MKSPYNRRQNAPQLQAQQQKHAILPLSRTCQSRRPDHPTIQTPPGPRRTYYRGGPPIQAAIPSYHLIARRASQHVHKNILWNRWVWLRRGRDLGNIAEAAAAAPTCWFYLPVLAATPSSQSHLPVLPPSPTCQSYLPVLPPSPTCQSSPQSYLPVLLPVLTCLPPSPTYQS